MSSSRLGSVLVEQIREKKSYTKRLLQRVRTMRLYSKARHVRGASRSTPDKDLECMPHTADPGGVSVTNNSLNVPLHTEDQARVLHTTARTEIP